MRFLAACLAFVSVPALADVEPGNWELSTSTQLSISDKPAALTLTQCITAADAKNPARLLGAGPGCQFSNRREAGGVFSFDVSCGGALPMRGSGSMRYSARSLEGDLDLTADAGGGQRFGLRSKISGRRLGPC